VELCFLLNPECFIVEMLGCTKEGLGPSWAGILQPS
jgi:hypothetical protein